ALHRAMVERGLCCVTGCEPQREGLAALREHKSDLDTYLPYVVGGGGGATMRICRAPGMTSLLAPDPTALRHFPGFSEWGQVVRETPVMTRRIDDIAEIDVVDFIKIDVQGSELTVFRNGRERLKDVVVIQTEVSFITLYRGQPAFGEIDVELRSAGFVPHSFVAINKRMIAPLVGDSPFAALNQLLEADIVYVRDFMRPERMSVEQLKHLAL